MGGRSRPPSAKTSAPSTTQDLFVMGDFNVTHSAARSLSHHLHRPAPPHPACPPGPRLNPQAQQALRPDLAPAPTAPTAASQGGVLDFYGGTTRPSSPRSAKQAFAFQMSDHPACGSRSTPTSTASASTGSSGGWGVPAVRALPPALGPCSAPRRPSAISCSHEEKVPPPDPYIGFGITDHNAQLRHPFA